MSKLIHIPNIDKTLEEKLHSVGIDTVEQLREKGSRHVFLRIKTSDSSACYNMLLSLEGAVRGVLADELDEQVKDELKEFMEIFNR